ncbi:MAG: hypothetical protein CME59_10115 [Halioglobus sp.]|nr:hypothetical protein [Halioglobus sp.]
MGQERDKRRSVHPRGAGDRHADFRAGPLLLAVTTVLACFGSAVAQASAGGRSGFSGDPGSNAGATCSVCHTPGASPPELAFVGSTQIQAGATNNFYLFVMGGPGVTAGVNIAAGAGSLAPYDGDLQLLDGELTHSAPKPFGPDYAAFVFSYTAPNYDTEVSFYAAGNSTDGELDLLGDAVGTASFDIAVVNGFEEPPPPPQPASGELRAELFATGLSSPVAIAHAGDERLFVAERGGAIRIVQPDGSVNPTPFLDLSGQVDDSRNEMGLLGLAFHPDYSDNGQFYVYYTRDPGPGLDRSRVARFTVGADPDSAALASEQVLLEFEQPYANHNGGDLHFGPDGYLYIASGDGGSGGDPQDNAQDTTSLLGKLLRIDVDTPAASGTGPDCNIHAQQNYSIPPGNAYNDGAGGDGCDEIFALGARNPWRFSFDRHSGALWIGDVGQNAHEEVHYLPAGSSGGINLGWRCYEGDQPYNLANCDRDYLSPVHTYDHATSGCSITGGRVYRGSRFPQLQGQYFFSDFCQPSIRALEGPEGDFAHRVVLPAGEVSAPSTFGEDAAGELYVGSLTTGRIYHLLPEPPPGC